MALKGSWTSDPTFPPHTHTCAHKVTALQKQTTHDKTQQKESSSRHDGQGVGRTTGSGRYLLERAQQPPPVDPEREEGPLVHGHPGRQAPHPEGATSSGESCSGATGAD